MFKSSSSSEATVANLSLPKQNKAQQMAKLASADSVTVTVGENSIEEESVNSEFTKLLKVMRAKSKFKKKLSKSIESRSEIVDASEKVPA